MTEDGEWSLPSTPSEHKSIAPYFQRAQELRSKDPIMAYWCTLYGVERGVASKPQNTHFLSQVVNILEKMKSNLAKYEAVTSNEAGLDHVEKFATRVFSQADNEVRNGTATRSTARKFLASAHFFEVMGVFDPELRADISEKIKYARWKAVNLAKLSREGSKLAPAETDGDRCLTFSPISQDEGDTNMVVPPPSSVFTWSPNTSIAPSPITQDRRPMETSPSSTSVALPDAVPPQSSSEVHMAPAPAVSHTNESVWSVSPPRTPPSRHHPSTLSLGTHEDHEVGLWSNVATPGTPAFDEISCRPDEDRADDEQPEETGDPTSVGADMARESKDTTASITEDRESSAPVVGPYRVVKRVHFTPSVKGGSSASSSVDDGSPPASLHGDSPGFYIPSLPTVEENSHAISENDNTQEITSEKDLPNLPSQMTPSETISSLPSPPISVPSPLLPHLPQETSLYSVPPFSYPITPPSVPPPPPARMTVTASIRPPSLPDEELTTTQISRIQKHCRFAISALDYEDPETARRELRAALQLLGDSNINVTTDRL